MFRNRLSDCPNQCRGRGVDRKRVKWVRGPKVHLSGWMKSKWTLTWQSTSRAWEAEVPTGGPGVDLPSSRPRGEVGPRFSRALSPGGSHVSSSRALPDGGRDAGPKQTKTRWSGEPAGDRRREGAGPRQSGLPGRRPASHQQAAEGKGAQATVPIHASTPNRLE